MNRKDLLDEFRSIRRYCRQKAAESFDHPMKPKASEKPAEQPTEAPPEVSDAELSTLLEG